MKAFQNIDEFIAAAFPLEYDKIIKQRKTPVEKSIENIDNAFNEELEKIIKGEGEKEKMNGIKGGR